MTNSGWSNEGCLEFSLHKGGLHLLPLLALAQYDKGPETNRARPVRGGGHWHSLKPSRRRRGAAPSRGAKRVEREREGSVEAIIERGV